VGQKNVKLWKILSEGKKKRNEGRTLTHISPKCMKNLALEKFEGFSSLNYAILSLGKCLNYQVSDFQMGDIF